MASDDYIHHQGNWTDIQKHTMKILFYSQRQRVEDPTIFTAHFNANLLRAQAASNNTCRSQQTTDPTTFTAPFSVNPNGDRSLDDDSEYGDEWRQEAVMELLAWVIESRNFLDSEEKARPDQYSIP